MEQKHKWKIGLPVVFSLLTRFLVGLTEASSFVSTGHSSFSLPLMTVNELAWQTYCNIHHPLRIVGHIHMLLTISIVWHACHVQHWLGGRVLASNERVTWCGILWSSLAQMLGKKTAKRVSGLGS